MRENPSIIDKLKGLVTKIKDSYEYQKTLLEINTEYSKNFTNIHPDIKKEFDYIFSANLFNL